MECETVRVTSPVTPENPLGYVVINLADLTNDHELFHDEPANTKPAAK